MTRSSRTEEITRTLREEVLRGQYRPGERLPSERDLAARFGTTRGVVRVALKKLEQLGVADVQPGGCRVQPLSEASLDVVGHLLELDGLPDPELLDQVLEVIGALLTANVRIAVERGRTEDLDRVLELIADLRATPEASLSERHERIHRLVHLLVDQNGNMIMNIVRRSLRSEALLPLQSSVPFVDPGTGQPSAEARQLIERLRENSPFGDELETAIRDRDGLAAYEAAHQMWSGFRREVAELVRTLRRSRALAEVAS